MKEGVGGGWKEEEGLVGWTEEAALKASDDVDAPPPLRPCDRSSAEAECGEREHRISRTLLQPQFPMADW